MTVVAQSVLIEAGLEHNVHLLDQNKALSPNHRFELSAPWNLPSRLFQFPIEVGSADVDGLRAIGLMHPALADHPFVKHVSGVVGFDLAPGGAPNENGVSSQKTGVWWHAADLIRAGKWRELLQTRQFTTDEAVAGAVAHGLGFKGDREGISVAHARVVMAAIGAPAPSDAVSLLCEVVSVPTPLVDEEGVTRWPLNGGFGRAAADQAWVRILGLEAGWFAHSRSGFICWTQLGRDRYAAGPGGGDTFTESTGQGAFAF